MALACFANSLSETPSKSMARNPVTDEKAVHSADPDQNAALDQSSLHLGQGHVALIGNQFTDEAAMGLDLPRMPVAAARLGHGPAMFQRKSAPADRA